LRHTFNEAYSPSRKKWVWIDSQYCVYAEDSSGTLLSVLDIIKYYKNNYPIKFIFFGNKEHFLFGKPIFPLYHRYGGAKAFTGFTLTNGNNILK
jgi:hypothetical protein